MEPVETVGYEDTEEQYRLHLAKLISRTKSRGNTRYFNQYVNRCRAEAAIAYPNGSAAAHKRDNRGAGLLGVLAAIFAIFG